MCVSSINPTDAGDGTIETVKCHPETVVRELVWGCAKYEFRNHVNTKSCVSEILFKNIRTSLGTSEYVNRRCKKRPAPLTLEKVRNMGRYTRDLIRSYASFSTPGAMKRAADSENCTNYSLIKNHAKKQKSHRGVVVILSMDLSKTL